MVDDPAAIAREIAERTILQGKDEPGTQKSSDNQLVSVSITKNGDLAAVTISPNAAPGVDVKRLEADILQAWRRAQRSLFMDAQKEMQESAGTTAPESFYQAIEERFRDQPSHATPPEPEQRLPRRSTRPAPPSDDDYFEQDRLPGFQGSPRTSD